MKFNFPPTSSYFEAADEVLQKNLQEPPIMMQLIQGIDELIRNEIFLDNTEINVFGANLAMSSYMMFLAAVRQALSGHEAAVFPLARASLEAACYALLISDDDELANIWANRHKDEKSEKASKKVFGTAVSDVAKSFDASGPNFAKMIRDLYQNLIDLGAHPNPRSVIPHISYSGETNDMVAFNLTSIYSAGSLEVNRALLICFETAYVSAALNLNSFGRSKSTNLASKFEELNDLKESLTDTLRT